MYNMRMNRPTKPESTRPLRPARATGRAVPPPRRRPWLWPVLAVALIALVVAGVAFATRSQSDEIAGLMTFDNLSRDHTDGPVTYPQTPPVGGPHNAQWQNCGVYSEPIANQYALHSLEHGAVWITYQPDLPAEQVAQLGGLANMRSHTLVSPYPDLPAPIVASAWGLQITAESADDPRLRPFLDTYERGRQSPEPGASCRGGVSN